MNGQLVKVNVRDMISGDLDEILDIEQSVYHEWDAWKEKDFRIFRGAPNFLFSATSCGIVRGYAAITVEAEHFELVRLAVHADFQRLRIGTQIINYLRQQLVAVNREAIEITVRENDIAGQKFLAANDFRCRQTITRHFEGTGEDGYRFQFREFDPPDVTTKHAKDTKLNHRGHGGRRG